MQAHYILIETEENIIMHKPQ